MAEDLRSIRLRNDHAQMSNLRGHMIDWQPIRGQAPYVEEYLLTVRVRTIVHPHPRYRDAHQIRVILPRDYPMRPPAAFMLTKPWAYHPNWYATDGRWCYGSWSITESLAQYVLRMVRSLQYDMEITNENSPANAEANRWYKLNRSVPGLFPCDTQPLPSPEREKKVFNMRIQGP